MTHAKPQEPVDITFNKPSLETDFPIAESPREKLHNFLQYAILALSNRKAQKQLALHHAVK